MNGKRASAGTICPSYPCTLVSTKWLFVGRINESPNYWVSNGTASVALSWWASPPRLSKYT